MDVQSVARGKDESLPQSEQMKVVAESLKRFCRPQTAHGLEHGWKMLWIFDTQFSHSTSVIGCFWMSLAFIAVVKWRWRMVRVGVLGDMFDICIPKRLVLVFIITRDWNKC